MSKKNNNFILCAALSYIFVGIIWFFIDEKMRHDGFVKFHVQQGLVLLVTSIILQIAAFMLFFISWILTPIISVILLVFIIIGIINATSGKKKELPIIGEYGKKFLI